MYSPLSNGPCMFLQDVVCNCVNYSMQYKITVRTTQYLLMSTENHSVAGSCVTNQHFTHSQAVTMQLVFSKGLGRKAGSSVKWDGVSSYRHGPLPGDALCTMSCFPCGQCRLRCECVCAEPAAVRKPSLVHELFAWIYIRLCVKDIYMCQWH